MLLLQTEPEAAKARKVLAHYRAELAAIAPDATGPEQFDRARAQNMIAEIQRAIAMWEAGIREPVPGNPELVSPPWTLEQVNAMSDEDYERTSLQAGILLKQAEIGNIDHQIGIVLDRIADWRRHRAWLEREISELTTATDRQPAASRA